MLAKGESTADKQQFLNHAYGYPHKWCSFYQSLNVRRKKNYYLDENLTVDPFTSQGIQIGS